MTSKLGISLQWRTPWIQSWQVQEKIFVISNTSGKDMQTSKKKNDGYSNRRWANITRRENKKHHPFIIILCQLDQQTQQPTRHRVWAELCAMSSGTGVWTSASIPQGALAVLLKVCITTLHPVQEEDQVERPTWKGFLCHKFGFDSKDNGEPREGSKQGSGMARTKLMAVWS